jgi:hypothetical protein
MNFRGAGVGWRMLREGAQIGGFVGEIITMSSGYWGLAIL